MEPSMRAPARAELATTNSGGEGHPPVLRITKGMSPRARDRLIRTAERTGARLIHESSNGAHQHES